ncbi:MAG: RluA family pseudouridine synthase [Candidatus Margulisbacteria bacterium]|nr:RluA family pseudouridine synthase [Candidatus Margulisiibacteriota bacterium]MBU1617221.1 RluA family pseudouridine synthase [Candidatus Margulisiibacteriota bacterium]
MTERHELIVPDSVQQIRLDQFLAGSPGLALSRSQVKELIDHGLARLNGEQSKASARVKPRDLITVEISAPQPPTARPETIPLDIIHEDDDIIVINKPQGLVVHPAPGNYEGTLVNALLAHCRQLATLGGPLRPGIVHRLDKETSGVIVVAKTDLAYRSLIKQIKDRTIEKTYLALVHGTPSPMEGTIEANIGRHPVNRQKMAVLAASGSHRSRTALSHYRIKDVLGKYSLLEVKILTGRTHQIRVHLSHIGHPIVGDPVYGRKQEEFRVRGQLLHAYRLSFDHPISGNRVEFSAPMPQEMSAVINTLTLARQ